MQCVHEEAFTRLQGIMQPTVDTVSALLGTHTHIQMDKFGSCRAALCNLDSDVDVLIYFSNMCDMGAEWAAAWRQTCFGFVTHSLFILQERGCVCDVAVIPGKFTITLDVHVDGCARGTRFDVHVDGCRESQHTYVWTADLLRSSFMAGTIGFRTRWLELLKMSRDHGLVQRSGGPRGKTLKGAVFSLLIAAAIDNSRSSFPTASCDDVLLKFLAELEINEL